MCDNFDFCKTAMQILQWWFECFCHIASLQSLVWFGSLEGKSSYEAPQKVAFMWGNLFWGNHSADLLNFGRSQTSSLVSRPKFSKKYESTTAITSIVICVANQLRISNQTIRHSERSEESKKISSQRQITDSPKQSAGFANEVKQPSKSITSKTSSY